MQSRPTVDNRERPSRRSRRSQDRDDHEEYRRRAPSRSTSLLSVANQPPPKISLKKDDPTEDKAQAQMINVSTEVILIKRYTNVKKTVTVRI